MTYTAMPSMCTTAARLGVLLTLLAALAWTTQPCAARAATDGAGDDAPRFITHTATSKAPLVLSLHVERTGTAASCKECGFGADNADKVRQLTLQYIGLGADVTVKVYDNADPSPSKLLYDSTPDFPTGVNNGDTFGFNASTIGRSEFSSKIGIWVGTEKVAELHTSCSDAIGPGTTEQSQEKGQDPNGQADFRVESGQDKDGFALCAPPPPPPCQDCKGGVDKLVLTYLGATPRTVTVYNDKDPKDPLGTFSVTTGTMITVLPPSGDDKLNNELSIWDGGTKLAEFHTSCSTPIGPGTTEGTPGTKHKNPNGEVDFQVFESFSKDNGKICPAPPPPPCLECSGGVISLTLQYAGNAADLIVVRTGNVTYNNIVLDANNRFTITGTRSDGKFESNDLDFFVNGTQVGSLHVSCSDEIGPGTTDESQGKGRSRFSDGNADFTVAQAISKDNGKVCPVGSNCVSCGFGADDADKVSQLTLAYTGSGTNVHLQVYDNADNDPDKLLYDSTTDFPTGVNNGDTFTFNASTIGQSEFSSKIGVWVNGSKLAELHTSCSDALGPGTTEQNQSKAQDPNPGDPADITMVDGKDKGGNPLRDPNDTGPPTVQYSFVNSVSETCGPAGSCGSDRFIRVDISDDTRLTHVDITLQDQAIADCDTNPACTINLVPVESSEGITCEIDPFVSPECIVVPSSVPSTCTVSEGGLSCDFAAGTTSAFFTFRLENFTQNTLLFTSTSDGCEGPCVDVQAPVVSFTEPNQTVLIAVSDDQAVQSFTTFRLANLNPPAVPPVLPQASFTVLLTRIDPNSVASFGALAADQCNAFVFDPETASKRGAATTAGETPYAFALSQNYPNPFNPSTQISFSLPETGQVRLVVYDVLGRQVRVLADAEYAAGRHGVVFEARDLASGTYFYRLESAAGVQVRQMMLMK